jgi:phage-related protein
MAGLRTVSIKFNGDAKGLEQAASKAEAGLSSVADKADNLDSKSGQATDSLGALSSGFELVGLDQYAAGLQSVALGTDFLSGVGTGLNLIMQLQSVQFIKAKVEALAYAVQQKAIAVATKAWTLTQWALNAAMTANPIGLLVLLIVGLIAVIVLLWNKNEGFRKALTAAWTAIQAALSAVGTWIRDTLWPMIQTVWNSISSAAGRVKDSIVNALGDKGAVGWLKGLPGKVSSAVSGLFNGVSSRATDAYNWVVGKLGDKGLVGWVGDLPGKISSAASGMFDGIKGAFRSALNWLIGKWNDLSFGIPAIDTHIPGVGKVGGFTLSTPNIPMLAKGGTAVAPGLALVGEDGPELLSMSRGASVIPLGRDAEPTILEAHIEIGGEVQRVVRVEMRKQNKALRRTVRAGAA